jgi:6-phospho-beta-glucosidase
MNKITILGGGGVRTPLVIHGLAQARDILGLHELCLFDPDTGRAETIARMGREIVRRLDGGFTIAVQSNLDAAAEGADAVLNSIRVGGMAGRARDERLAIEHGFAGQETTGPGGATMALRTLPVTLAYARAVERVSPSAWFINFTNPAGLMTQALAQQTKLRVIGICDTPSELFHRLGENLGVPAAELTIDYAGLNHLGWVRRVERRGEDLTAQILADRELLRRLYPADLFDPELIQTLGLIPTEYLFFYYSQRRAYRNQVRAGASRGEELARMNAGLFDQLACEDAAQALATYRAYLLQRNASYLKLEAEAGSAFQAAQDNYDPFETATGYHRIALDVLTGLVREAPREVVLNVTNLNVTHGHAIDGLLVDDVVEVPCEVNRGGARPKRTGPLPQSIRGLVESVKQYERRLIHASLMQSKAQARLALMECPIVGGWEPAGELLDALIAADPENLGYLS